MFKHKKKIIGSLQAATALALCISMAFAASYSSKADVSYGSKTLTGNLVRTELDTSKLRSQYFNKDVVQTTETKTAKFEGERWIIVELDGEDLYSAYEKEADDNTGFSEFAASGRAKTLKKSITASHNAFLNKLDQSGIKYEFKYSYSVLNNGVALKVDAANYEAIKKIDGVKRVEFSERYAEPKVAVKNDANVYATGIYNSQNINEKGEGMVVAVLDTGLDYSHEAFAAMPDHPAWDKNYVATKIAEAGDGFYAKVTAEEAYYNAKIPYAYDYADDDADVYPSYSTHGTHVAGIVAGKSDYVVNKETEETFIGVAPQAQLVICKVFTDNLDSDGLGGADTIDIISAVSDCVALGVDVINMSLGSSAGFATESDNEPTGKLTNEIYARVKEAGISLVVAASNDYSSGFGGGNGTNLASNPDSGTVGSPSTYDAALSVASINGQKSAYIQANGTEDQVAFITEASDGDGNELDFVDQLYRITGKTKGETLNFKYVVIGSVGRTANYTQRVRREIENSDGYDGTIALVKRGDITFEEKVRNAMDAGATACVIYNNVSGTIRMSLGEVNNPIPTCAITMDAAKKIVEGAERNVGTIQIDSDFEAGPFMSDFSSWGPMPDLQLKPEITAHGGEITSAVPGGYDIYSGTSMAAPNMAGAIALLRQNLKAQGLKGKALSARVNQVLMSTATIARNEENNPYSPRKQGAGLAGIKNAIETESYITVKDENGNESDKTKIELYDDKTKTGVYEFDFTVNNVSGKEEAYSPKVYVMTETLATDNRTVAEKADMLDDSVIEITVGGRKLGSGENVIVPANGTVEVNVKITLTAATKAKLDKNFKNGMYVEGFVSLAGAGETKVTIGLPYLAFYGDWNDAPLFDYSIYDIAESEKDTSVPEEDKLKASAAETRVLGQYYDDKYIIALGSYLYEMSDSDVKIYAEKEKAAISIFDEKNNRSIYEVYMVYAGLLRGAKTIDIEVKDSVTGEIKYRKTKEKVSKSYAAGGGNRGAIIMLEIDAKEWNLQSNSSYDVTVKGSLDYEGGEHPANDEFDFTFTVDYEAPQILDYRIRFDPYTENKKVKYNIYLDVDVQDNQYVMDVMPCYVKQDKDGNVLTLASEYPVPVYGGKGEKSTVSINITDYYDELVKSGKLYLAVDDYALNQTNCVIDLASALEYPDQAIVSTADGRLTDVGEPGTAKDSAGVSYEYPIYDLEMRINELYAPVINASPDQTLGKSLNWYVKSGQQYVSAKDGEIFAKAAGKAVLYLKDGDADNAKIYACVELVVTSQKLNDPVIEKITLEPVYNSSDYVVNIDSVDPSFTMNPNQTAQIRAGVSPWYITDFKVEFVSSIPDILTVDSIGNVKALKKGTAYVDVIVTDNRTNKTLKKSVKVIVGDIYRIVNYTLYDYYGGEICEIPKDKNVMYIDEKCFSNNKTLKKVILPGTITEIPEKAFDGCENLEEIVIPSQLTTIRQEAFKNCRKLKKITLEKFVDRENNTYEDYYGAITIGKSAFENCSSLVTIENSKRLTTANDSAFAGCTSLKSIDISELRVTGREVFRDCTSLETVETSKFTDIGERMFANCASLKLFTFKGSYLKAGVFDGCKGLTKFTFEPGVDVEFKGIGEKAFAGTTKLLGLVLPAGKYEIGDEAFSESRIKTLDVGNAEVSFGKNVFKDCAMFVASGSSGFAINGSCNGSNDIYLVENGVLYNKNKTELVAVPCSTTNYVLPETVVKISKGALSGLQTKGAIDLSGVTVLGAYALAGSSFTSVNLNPSITVIPEGLFAETSALKTITGLDGVTKIGPYAFRGCAVENYVFAELTEIGESAFRDSGIKTIVADKLEVIGERAFNGCGKLGEAKFPSVRSIGENAFRSSGIVNAGFGAITEMGASAFVNANKLQSVTFGDGTTIIGASAFMSNVKRETLTSVTLPGTVKEIGASAFFNCSAIESINIDGVEFIGDYAFFGCVNLKSAELNAAKRIGNGAFSSTGLTFANLDNAEEVGSFAFMETPLETVTFGKLKTVGRYAFSDTKLETVVLPASFDSFNVNYEWKEYDEKGRLDEVKNRNEYAYGGGAFANIKTLKSITANGENVFSSDGVLYAKTANGLVLLQYPAAKEGESYVTLQNTCAVADSAFEGVRILKNIEFAYTVSRIGSYAFYDSNVTEYKFNSVKAPVLLAEFVDASDMDSDTIEAIIFGRSGSNVLGSTIYYSNFFDYVAKILCNEYFKEAYQTKPFNLKAIVPKNGTGYDNEIWKGFFTVERTEQILPDGTTHAFTEAIDALKAAKSVEEIGNATSFAAISEAAELARAARLKFNKITDPDQLALVGEESKALTAYESVLREKKKEFGQPVAVKELKIEKTPDKTRYVSGEKFNAEGMVVKFVFDDDSELIVNDYAVDKTTLVYGDEKVVVTCVYEGKSYSVNLLLNVEENSESNGGEDNGKSGCLVGALVGGGVGVAVVAAAVVALLYLKKKKVK